jgi:hypothetical protein
VPGTSAIYPDHWNMRGRNRLDTRGKDSFPAHII